MVLLLAPVPEDDPTPPPDACLYCGREIEPIPVYENDDGTGALCGWMFQHDDEVEHPRDYDYIPEEKYCQ